MPPKMCERRPNVAGRALGAFPSASGVLLNVQMAQDVLLEPGLGKVLGMSSGGSERFWSRVKGGRGGPSHTKYS